MNKLIKQVITALLSISLILPYLAISVYADGETQTNNVAEYTAVDFINQDHLIVTIPSMFSLDYNGASFQAEENIKVEGIKSWAKNYNVTVSTDTSIDFTNSDSDILQGSIELGIDGIETWNAQEVQEGIEKSFNVVLLPPYEKEGEYTSTIIFDIETSMAEPDYTALFTYTYDIENKTAVITGLTEEGQTWVIENVGLLYIPNHLTIEDERYAVTAIGDSAFVGNNNITEVYIEGWEGSLEFIGTSAFSNCTNATTLTIPKTVSSIESCAFYNWFNLSELNYDAANATVEADAFYDAGHSMSETGFTLYLGEDVETIPYYLGMSNSSDTNRYHVPFLRHINWGNATNLTLSSENFKRWDLTEIDFPTYLTEIPYGLCRYCENMRIITLPSNITSIGSYAFAGCNQVTDIYDNTGRRFYDTSAGTTIFLSNSGENNPITTYHFGDNWIGIDTFSGAFAYTYTSGDVAVSYVEKVDWGNYRPTTIGTYAFADVYFDGTVEIPDSVTTIKNRAFVIPHISYLKIPTSVTTIEDRAFGQELYGANPGNVDIVEYAETENYCDEHLTIGTADNIALENAIWLFQGDDLDRNENYFKYSYDNSTMTAAITGLSVIGQSKNLTVLNIPETIRHRGNTYVVNSIGTNSYTKAFENNTLIEEIIMPSIATINSYSFNNCTNLNIIRISNNLATVGAYAFGGDAALVEVYYAGTYAEAQGINISGYSNNYFKDTYATWYYNGVCSRAKSNGLHYLFDFDSNEWQVLGFADDVTSEQISNLVIPDEVNGYTVTSISSLVPFKNDTSIQSLTIGNNINSLPIACFDGCSNLKNVNLGNGLTSLPQDAFARTGLISIDFSDSNITSIGNYAFYNCDSLIDINLNGVSTIGQQAFSDCNALRNITISSSCTDLGYKTFYNSSNLSNINFEEGIESLTGDECFNKIGSNTVFIVPLTLTAINNQPFKNGYITDVYYEGSSSDRDNIIINTSTNTNFMDANWHYSISLNDNVAMFTYTTSESNATITGLAGTEEQQLRLIQLGNKLTIPTIISDGVNTYNVTAIEASAFAGNNAIQEIYMEEGCVTLGNQAFSNMTALTKVHLADTITIWGDVDIYKNGSGNYGSTFWNSPNLREVNIPTGVTSIPRSCFMNTAIISIEIPNNVETICTQAFKGCNGLTSITIPSSVRTIGAYAFQDCDYITEIYMEEGCEKLCYECFNNMDRLATVHLADSITDWGNTLTSSETEGGSIFYQCNSLSNVNIPLGVNCIPRSAFNNVIGLTSITIPANVLAIGVKAFSYCNSLEEVNFEEGCLTLCYACFEETHSLRTVHLADSITDWGNADSANQSVGGEVFWGSSLSEVNIPQGVSIIARGIFGSCDSLTSIDIPSNITLIGQNVFSGCSNLTTINLAVGLNTVKQNAFKNCNALTTVNYEGTTAQKENISINNTNNDKFKNATWNCLGANRNMSLFSMRRVVSPITILSNTDIHELAFSKIVTLNNTYSVYSIETMDNLGVLNAESEVCVIGYVTNEDNIIDWVIVETADGQAYMNASLEDLGIKLYSVVDLENPVNAMIFEDTKTYYSPDGDEYSEIMANSVVEVIGKIFIDENETDWVLLSDTSCLNIKFDSLCTDIYEINPIEPIEKVCEEISLYSYPTKETEIKLKDTIYVMGTVLHNGEEVTDWLYVQQEDKEGYIHLSLDDLADPIDEQELEVEPFDEIIEDTVITENEPTVSENEIPSQNVEESNPPTEDTDTSDNNTESTSEEPELNENEVPSQPALPENPPEIEEIQEDISENIINTSNE